jgi:hypothetical protein
MFTMPSTKTVLMILGLSIYLTIAFLLNKKSIKKFDYSFFSKQSFFIILACTGFFIIGNWFFPKNKMEINLNSVVHYLLLIASAISLGLLIWVNCKETSWWHGLLGSVIQIPLLIFCSIICIPFFLIAGFFKVLLLFGGSPPPDKTQFQKDEEWYHNRQNPNGFHRYEKY